MTATLEKRVAELEQGVEQLQRDAGEFAAPNLVTVNPDGTIGASFTGQVHAQGLDLDAGTSATPPNVDRLRWLRTSDGAAIAELFGYEAGGVDALSIAAEGVGGFLPITQLLLQTNAALDGNAGLFTTIGNQNQSQAKTIIDGLNRSSFLQLAAGAANRKINFGSATLTWPGASQASTVLVVNHGLAATPVIVLGQIFSSAGIAVAPYIATINTYTGTQFSVQGITTGAAPAAGSTAVFVYAAIG